MTTPIEARERLEYLRGEIEAERISYGEIAELQSLTEYIDPSDTVLLEWAGVPEFPPTCDICGHTEASEPETPWNGETGNHVSCEEVPA